MNNEIIVGDIVYNRVSRLAKTGDKILVNGYSTTAHPYFNGVTVTPPSNGEVFTVEVVDDDSGNVLNVIERGFAGYVYSTEYVVLEPVTTVTLVRLSDQPAAPVATTSSHMTSVRDVEQTLSGRYKHDTIAALIAILVDKGVFTLDELSSRHPAEPAQGRWGR